MINQLRKCQFLAPIVTIGTYGIYKLYCKYTESFPSITTKPENQPVLTSDIYFSIFEHITDPNELLKLRLVCKTFRRMLRPRVRVLIDKAINSSEQRPLWSLFGCIMGAITMPLSPPPHYRHIIGRILNRVIVQNSLPQWDNITSYVIGGMGSEPYIYSYGYWYDTGDYDIYNTIWHIPELSGSVPTSSINAAAEHFIPRPEFNDYFTSNNMSMRNGELIVERYARYNSIPDQFVKINMLIDMGVGLWRIYELERFGQNIPVSIRRDRQLEIFLGAVSENFFSMVGAMIGSNLWWWLPGSSKPLYCLMVTASSFVMKYYCSYKIKSLLFN